MPRLKSALPKLGKHKDQACCYLGGERVYLGKYGTRAAREKYDRVISEWLASGRVAADLARTPTVNDVLLAFLQHAKAYYVKNGQPTNEVTQIKSAVRVASGIYGTTPVEEFGPLALECVRNRMIENGWARKTINKHISRLIRAFKWAASREIIGAHIPEQLRTLEGLKKGRTAARETEPVRPVDDDTIEATLRELSPLVGDMVRLQRLLGCRPSEVCLLRPCDIDRTGDVWVFRPPTHKTEHTGVIRTVFIGPKAQEILIKYLLRPAGSYCFDPREAPGARSNSKERYTKDSLGRAVRRAAKQAGVPTWSPNRLRHARATEIRKQNGLEAAQTILGHTKADTSEIYAERDMELARRIAKQSG